MDRRPVAAAVSRWWDDPWSRGGWSLLRVGATADTRRALGRPFGAVVLAGEATHPDQAGMVHGAYEQGVAAADWCLGRHARRVVVVGAGAAGAGAARTLADAGADAVVFEARGRTGGRVHSTAVRPGLTLELGANWLQQGDRNSLAPLAAALGLGTVDTDFHAPRWFGGESPTAEVTEAVLAELQRRVDALPGDVSMQAVVDGLLADPQPWTPDVVQAVVDGEISIDTGAPLADLSARFGFEAGVGAGDRWVIGGYGQLIDHLLAGVDIRLDAPVERIEWTEDSATLVAAGERHTADAIVVTVPAAVLGAGTPVFSPPLPEAQRAALAALTTGRVEKAVLVFAQRWWPTSPSNYFRIVGDRPGQVSEWLDVTDALGVPAVTGIFIGDWAAQLWDGDDAQVAVAASAVLARTTLAP